MGIPCFAGGLYVSDPDDFYSFVNFSQFGNALQTQFGSANITVDANPLGDISAYSAAILLPRLFAPGLNATEVTNLNNFINSGKRVFIAGENETFFSAWNDSFLTPLGAAAGSDYGPSATVVSINLLGSNYLTNGVSTVSVVAAGTVGSGGTALSTPEVMAMFGTSSNVVTFLDYSALYGFDSSPNNVQFYGNVAGWLAGADTGAPEPASMALTGSVLGAALWWRRRRG